MNKCLRGIGSIGTCWTKSPQPLTGALPSSPKKIDGRPKKGTASDNTLGVRLLFSGLPEGAVVIDELEVTVLPR